MAGFGSGCPQAMFRGRPADRSSENKAKISQTSQSIAITIAHHGAVGHRVPYWNRRENKGIKAVRAAPSPVSLLGLACRS
jgi:hypothetical protein